MAKTGFGAFAEKKTQKYSSAVLRSVLGGKWLFFGFYCNFLTELVRKVKLDNNVI